MTGLLGDKGLVACSFWLVSALALNGRVVDGRAVRPAPRPDQRAVEIRPSEEPGRRTGLLPLAEAKRSPRPRFRARSRAATGVPSDARTVGEAGVSATWQARLLPTSAVVWFIGLLPWRVASRTAVRLQGSPVAAVPVWWER